MNYKDLSIRNYFIFGEVMRDPVLCRKVLETLLQTSIGELTVPENEKLIKFTKDGKAIRLDIYAEEKTTGRVFDAEMQNLNGHTRETLCLPKRSRFYQSLIDARQMERAQYYSDLKDTEIVFICTFDPFGKGLARYDFEEECKQLKGFGLGSGARKTFFNTTALDGELPETIKSLYDYINTGLVSDELTYEMDRAVGRVGTDNKVKDEIMRSELILMDMKREGHMEGLEEGRKEGLELGREEGLELGFKEGRSRTVLNLFHAGVITEAQGCKELGITAEEFKKLLTSE